MKGFALLKFHRQNVGNYAQNMSELDAAAVKKLKVVDLRAELTKRGLDAKGNKPALVERLLEAISSEPPTEEGKADEGSINNSEVEVKEETTEEAGSPDVPQQDGAVDGDNTTENTAEVLRDNEAVLVETNDEVKDVKTEEQGSPEAAVVDTEEKPEPMETNEESASEVKVEQQQTEGERNVEYCVFRGKAWRTPVCEILEVCSSVRSVFLWKNLGKSPELMLWILATLLLFEVILGDVSLATLPSECDVIAITYLLPRVINFKFPLQPHQKYHTVWRTWLFIAAQINDISLPILTSAANSYISLGKVGRMYFLTSLGLKGLNACLHWTKR